MGEWIVGAAINILGSIGINLGTNLLKLGHNQRERECAAEGGKLPHRKSVVQFQAWRAGLIVFFFGNCLNFISFGYAAQSLLAALGSVQFISNIGFAYFVLHELVTSRIILATAFIVVGNAFLVAFGNHQSPVFTPDELLRNYKNHMYLVYCAVLLIIIALHHAAYRKGRQLVHEQGSNTNRNWHFLMPFCYAVVSGAVGTHSVLFAKSLSILLRLTLNGESQLDGWFTYLLLSLFFVTAAFWMVRLNDGLSMFDAILIVPMLQISWTTFSIFTGFVYFQEYRVFDGFRVCMFIVGIVALFVGILLLAPQGSSSNSEAFKVTKPDDVESASLIANADRPLVSEQGRLSRARGVIQSIAVDALSMVGRAKTAYKMTMGFGQDQIHASSVFSMPMVSSSRSSWRNPSLYNDWLSSSSSFPPPAIDEEVLTSDRVSIPQDV
ncbi:probable magnesium transporter NIPA8 isoform X1 [Selaginella moellendorffii]|uniref:probable magnesium transporter NIPA8 isoform X1 n=1 Tax=Selaginella moellendorffii TaxID=88036 RepID=UPI000D1C333E|nr:probable magnesium transporter NIPA8 isoform X1 [Selaginella moellendorffii]|eukprot:XP_024523439.1 probable magnesium transporter NIPA8 isoform X1 [Selaginella moellendorffii]